MAVERAEGSAEQTLVELVPGAAVEGRAAAKELGEYGHGSRAPGPPAMQKPAHGGGSGATTKGSGTPRALVAHGESPEGFRGSELTEAGI